MNDLKTNKVDKSPPKTAKSLWPARIIRSGKSYTKWILLGLACWLIVRSFVVEKINIPSDSMQETLRTGDEVYVHKYVYGPRIPITILSIPYTGHWLNWIELPYYRFPGSDEVRINDLIAFNSPTDTASPIDCRPISVMRCVGLPGDSFSIVRGRIMVNGNEIADPENRLYMYYVVLKPTPEPDSLFKHVGINGKYSSADNVHYVMHLTTSQADSLSLSAQTISVTRSILDADRFDQTLFPQNPSKQYRWNADNFGPLSIPKKGDTIDLSLENIHLYKTLISVYEENVLENRHDSIFINGNYTTTYVFKMDYYFVIGDNRYDANDSRWWGFLPEDHVIGRIE